MEHTDSVSKASLLVEATPEVQSVVEELTKDDFERLFDSPRAGDVCNDNATND